MLYDIFLATQIVSMYIESVPEYGEELRGNDVHSPLLCLTSGRAICRDDAECLRNLFSCVQIESKVVSGDSLDGEGKKYGDGHAWLQVKLGNAWYNLDATFARQSIKKGKLSGDLFVSDEIFYGPRRFMNFLKGDIIDCKTEVGGHQRRTYAEKSASFLRPTEIQQFMDGAKSYADLSRNDEKWLGSVNLIPYQGSSVQRERILAIERESSQPPVEI